MVNLASRSRWWPSRAGSFLLVWLGLLASPMAWAADAIPPPIEEAQETYGLVILIDGAKGDTLKHVAENGLHGEPNLTPNIKKYFMDNGVWVRQATTVFPSITGAGVPSVLTGCFPGRTKFPSLYFFDRATGEYAILYLFNEALQWNRWLSKEVKTIWEYFEGADDALAFGPALYRGADEHMPVVYNFKYKPGQIRAKLAIARRDLRRRIVGGQPARLIVAYNGWFDHREHMVGSASQEIVPEYRDMDRLVGETIEDFQELIEERKATGVKVNYYVALVSDHGHKDISGTLSLDAFLREKYRVKNVQKDLTMVAGQAVSGTMPSDLSGFDCLIAAGEGHGLFYFPMDGKFNVRPPLSHLRHFPYRGNYVDVPRDACATPAVGFMLAKGEDGKAHVYSRVDRDVPGDREPDESTIEKVVVDGVAMYRYQVVRGKDPLGFAEHEATKELVASGPHTAREWQLATAKTEYPDAIVQLVQIFDAGDRAPDFFLSAYQGISIGDSVAAGTGSKHGGLTRDESWATLAFFGSGLKKAEVATARNVDMVPTMLALMGRDFDQSKLDGEPVPEVLEMVQAARAERFPERVAAKANLEELKAHVARLEKTEGEAVFPWARTFQALASRPIADTAEVRRLRAQAFETLKRKTGDAAAQRLVRGESAQEFLVRPRVDLPPGPPVTNPPPANPETLNAMSRDVADALYRHIFTLMGEEFDRQSLQNQSFWSKGVVKDTATGAGLGALGGAVLGGVVGGILGPLGIPVGIKLGAAIGAGVAGTIGGVAGYLLSPAESDRSSPHKPADARAEIDKAIATLEKMRAAGLDVPAPVLEYKVQNGPNLRYRGLGGREMSAESRAALDEFTRSERGRAGQGSSLNPRDLLRRAVYRQGPAEFQAGVGSAGQAAIDRVRSGPATPVNLNDLAETMAPGEARTLLSQMSRYGESASLGAAVTPTLAPQSAPASPQPGNAPPAATPVPPRTPAGTEVLPPANPSPRSSPAPRPAVPGTEDLPRSR